MRRLLLLAAAALLAAPARASFEDLGAGARAPGMGDAFTALADDAYAVHYNPAGLAQMNRSQFSATYSRLYLGLSDGSDLGTSNLVFAHPLAHGRRGTLGLAWDQFSLAGLYSEQTMTLSYGRRVWTSESGAMLMTGVNLKRLSHSFTAGSEASAACDQGRCGLGSDAMLSGKTSKSAYGADLGLIYRFPHRFQAGLSILNANQPDVGFSGGDKLGREYNLGLAYRSLWLSLIGELKTLPSAVGGADREMIFAAERFFPTLDYGQFGLRGSLGFGLNSSDWKQMTIGASYRINKIQFDYGFIIPVGGVQAQSGSHRVSLTFHFGAPTEDEQISRDLLEEARHLHEQGPDYGYEYSEQLKPQDLNDPRLADVRRLIEERRYRLAQKALGDVAAKQPLSEGLVRLSNRLGLVVYYYEDLPEPKDNFDHALTDAIHRFFYGQDRLAMLQASYALSMKPEDAKLDHMLADMEKAVKIKATRLPADHPRGFLEELLFQAEFANTRGDMGRVETLLGDTLVLDPQNATALERLGSLRYLAGRLPQAISAWEAALKVETRDHELESLHEYLRAAQDRAVGKPLPGGGLLLKAPVEAPAAAVPAPQAEASPVPRAEPPVRRAPPPAGDPRDIAGLYQKGVEHYARGEYLEASAMFLRILQIDPGNDQARKALERIQSRRSRQ